MGNQAHANDHMRRCVELIRAGIVGKVKEIHAWTNRPIWPQGFSAATHGTGSRGNRLEPVDRSGALGRLQSRIAPFAWRGWWNYGTGALGDMACHIMDMGYWSMQPGGNERLSPNSVIARQAGATELSPPINSVITWEFGTSPYAASDGFNFQLVRRLHRRRV